MLLFLETDNVLTVKVHGKQLKTATFIVFLGLMRVSGHAFMKYVLCQGTCQFKE